MSHVIRHVRYEFTGDVAERPVLYPLARHYEVIINLRAGSVTEDGGFVVLELRGEAANVDAVLQRLTATGGRLSEENGTSAT